MVVSKLMMEQGMALEEAEITGRRPWSRSGEASPTTSSSLTDREMPVMDGHEVRTMR